MSLTLPVSSRSIAKDSAEIAAQWPPGRRLLGPVVMTGAVRAATRCRILFAVARQPALNKLLWALPVRCGDDQCLNAAGPRPGGPGGTNFSLPFLAKRRRTCANRRACSPRCRALVTRSAAGPCFGSRMPGPARHFRWAQYEYGRHGCGTGAMLAVSLRWSK